MAKPPLIDSMEEMALKFSESVERQSKSLDERNIKGTTRHQRVERVEKLAELYRLLDYNDNAGLELHSRRLQMQLQHEPTLRTALTLTHEDPVQTDILLQKALHNALADGRQTDTDTFRQLIDELRLAHGEKIRAGFNTATAIAMFSRDPRERMAMRQLYYKSIVGQQPLAGLLEALLEHFGEEQLTRGLRTLQKALADDIAALAPSLPGGILGSMLKGLDSCGQINSLLKNTRDLVQRLGQQLHEDRLSALTVSKRLLRFCAQGFFSRDIALLTQEAVGDTPRLYPLFLNCLYSLLKGLPLVLWKDLKTRQNGLRLLQNRLHETVRQEQEALGVINAGRSLR